METDTNQKLNKNSKVECKPFIKWAGGKSQLLLELSRITPTDFSGYYEPFLGGGALFFHLQPKNAVLVDINQDLINCYKVVQNNVENLIEDLKQHYYDKEYFYQIRNIDRSSEYLKWTTLQKASRFIFLNKTCYNGLHRVNSKSQFNVPFGKYKNPKIVDPDNLRACSQTLKTTTLLCNSFLSVEHKITSEDFVYFDPPYVPLTETSNFTNYSKDGFDISMQVELRDLCERLDSRKIRFMLSNSSAPFVLDLYRQFNLKLVDASRSINSSGSKRGLLKEVIITNYKL